MAAFLLALPAVLCQVWAFVAPGLYHEKRLVFQLVISSTILFLIGVPLCYFLVIPGMSKFIQAVAPTSIARHTSTSNSISDSSSRCSWSSGSRSKSRWPLSSWCE